MEGETISKFEDLVHSCQEEIQLNGMTREEFLASCACHRIAERSSKYDREFDKYLSLLETNELNSNGLDRLATSLEALSSLVTSSYESLIKEVLKYQKKFFE